MLVVHLSLGCGTPQVTQFLGHKYSWFPLMLLLPLMKSSPKLKTIKLKSHQSSKLSSQINSGEPVLLLRLLAWLSYTELTLLNEAKETDSVNVTEISASDKRLRVIWN